MHLLGLYLISLSTLFTLNRAMTRTTRKVSLPSSGIGSNKHLIFHHYGPTGSGKAYIQASLHADELPGLLVANHLMKLLDAADKENRILKEIVVVPYANPVGLSQVLLGNHIGRFSLATGVNFNRNWSNLFPKVSEMVKDKLTKDDANKNKEIVRNAMLEVVNELEGLREEEVMKKELLRVACTSDIVLDLHCDSDAVMHMYTHDRLWPALSDLAYELGTHCNLLDSASGGQCFDESCSCPWATLQDLHPGYALPMGCESTTVELRGQAEVYDDIALGDAQSLFRFLQRRGYIKGDIPPIQPELVPTAVPLTGVDMIQATVPGVLSWVVRPGQVVEKGQILGHIVSIEDPDAPRVPLAARTSGVVFSMSRHKLAVPGAIVIKVAGKDPLPWRKGNLLTSR